MHIRSKTLKDSRPPRKPSKLIRMALRDMEKVEKLKRYEVDMSDWHSSYEEKEKLCSVCFAGCVMSQRFKLSYKKSVSPLDFSPSWKNAFRALDSFRMGELVGGLNEMRIKHNYQLLPVTVVRYCHNPKSFKEDMEVVIKTLEKAGF